jgi:sulfite reductase (ferredoxin)
MRFYQIPAILAEEINQLEVNIAKFKSGEIHPIKFRAFRVPFGIYEQRTENTFMLRIRCTAGGATPSQLIKVAELANKYGKPLIHLTTRQEIQLHDIELDDSPEILRKLMTAGLSSRGGGGNTVRNIMASYDSGINPNEVFDVSPYAIALGSRMMSESDSWTLPRKFKISFSSLASDNALAVLNDLGYIARIKDGIKGFQVYTAGGMGARSRIAHLLHDFISEDKVNHVCTALKRLYLKHGNRKNKNANRLRFLWEELGERQFLNIYRETFDKISGDDGLVLEKIDIANTDTVTGIKPVRILSDAFKAWASRYVSDQKQPGLKSIMVPINLGDLNSEDAIKLGRLLEPFGENVLRFTMNQNINIRNIPEAYLGNIFEGILEIETLSYLPEVYGNMIACAGADTCMLGICLPRKVTPVIQKYLLGSNSEFNLPPSFKINISGCPNACGQHPIADLGFFGRTARNKGRAYPAFYVMAGAVLSGPKPRFADKIGWIPSKDMPAAIFDILNLYNEKIDQFPVFAEYVDNGGRGEIAAICEKYSNNVPVFEEHKNYFFDWGSTSIFTTTKMSHGECSAGIYDMIDVEMKAIKTNQKQLEQSSTPAKTQSALWNIVYSAANMLLVARGIDPRNEEEAFDRYIKHFIDSGLVANRYKKIVLLAKNKDHKSLVEKKDQVIELGEVMIRLYHRMDNSLRFPGENEMSTQACSFPKALVPKASETVKDEVFTTKDFRGVVCPINFVKTKLALSRIPTGERLEIWLDDGESINSVPRSAIREGHRIISERKVDNYWTVVIEKA